MPEVQAIYLHVVDYNEAAIQLYESQRFIRLERFPNFYNLHGSPYDSFLYALYIHHDRHAWKMRLWQNWHTLSQLTHYRKSLPGWVMSAWTSIWNGTTERKHYEVEDAPQMTPP
jgi:hypothetical protein